VLAAHEQYERGDHASEEKNANPHQR
jgi:hypothetical protein